MQRQTLIVGGCNRPLPYFAAANSPGIAVIEADFETGTCTRKAVYGEIDNPTFLAQAPGGTLIATSEMAHWPEGTVTALRGIGTSSSLHSLGRQASAGSIAAFVGLDRSARFLFVVNHGGIGKPDGRDQAIAVIRLDSERGVGEIVASAAQSGSGPVLPRQERSHPHAAVATADNRHLVVSDLGADALVIYRFDAATGRIERAHSVAMAPGAGPRHMAFSHGGRRLHVGGELDSTVTSYGIDLASGALDGLGRCSTLPPVFTGQNRVSEIANTPSGRAVYVGNRGHDSIAIVDVDTADGAPVLRETVQSGGRTPRHFAIDETGRRLAVANQDSDRICFFTIDEDDDLTALDMTLDIGTPTCVLFWNIEDAD